MLYLEGRRLEMKEDKRHYLVTKNGECVFVESAGLTPQMVARTVQISSRKTSSKVSLVLYTDIFDNIHCMAFCFKLMDKEYYPVVTGDKIGFEETLTSDKKFWFQWGEKTGHFRTVKSVAQPDMFLHVCNEGEVTIRSQPLSFFRVYVAGNHIEMIQEKIPMYLNTKQSNDESTSRMVVQNCKISDHGNPSEESNHIDIIQDEIPDTMYPNTRYRKYMSVQSNEDESTCRMVVQNCKVSDYGNPSEESNHIEMIQDKIPMYPNTRYRKYMSVRSNDESTCQMVVQNCKLSDYGNPSEEERRPEMIQDSRPMYLKTRHRQYMWIRSKDGSTNQMVVENIKIRDNRNPSKGRTRGFDKYIAVKRQMNDIHSFNGTTKGHHFCSNLGVKKI